MAYALDIPYEVLDFTADFREQIIEKIHPRVYEAGGTPNPCIDCNKYMKFRHLLDWAEEHGMEYVVTGHYARVEQDAATGRWLLEKGLGRGARIRAMCSITLRRSSWHMSVCRWVAAQE